MMTRRFIHNALCKTLMTTGIVWITCFSAVDSAENTKAYPSRITLLPSLTVMSYSQNVRFSQVLTDALKQSNDDVYQLGITLIDPHKQTMIDVRKRKVLLKLKRLNTPEAENIAQQLSALRLGFHLPIEQDLVKVLTQPKLDPMIKQEYGLVLPLRPDHIRVFNPRQSEVMTLAFKPGADLLDYISQLSSLDRNNEPYESAWIIQADRNIYYVEDIRRHDKRYFLSPGAMVFMGLQNLPEVDRELNQEIAELLALRLEL